MKGGELEEKTDNTKHLNEANSLEWVYHKINISIYRQLDI